MNQAKNKGYFTDGVSESIGFLLIFTMVIVGIGLVTLYGYPMLLAQQTSADEQIMEKNMIVLQNDMKSLAFKTVPYTETSLKIGGGTLFVTNASNDGTTFRLYHGGLTPQDSTFRVGELRYESLSANRIISVQSGSVVARNLVESGSTMLAEPRWFYDGLTNTWIVNIISINSTGNLSRAGIGTVQMALGETSFNETVVDQGVPIRLDYTPDAGQDYSTAWDNYFRNVLKMNNPPLPPPTVSGSTTTYTLPIDNTRPSVLVIKKIDVIIKSV